MRCFIGYHEDININTKFSIDAETGILTTKSDPHTSSAFCKKIIKPTDGKYRWTFKLLKYKSNSLRFGIVKNNEIKRVQKDFLSHIADTVYVFNGATGAMMQHEIRNRDHDSTRAYKKKFRCKQGDIIDLYLDMDKLTFSAAVNNAMHKKVLNIDKCEYRAAVSVWNKDYQIQIIKST